jgi:hypothetical protein
MAVFDWAAVVEVCPVPAVPDVPEIGVVTRDRSFLD